MTLYLIKHIIKYKFYKLKRKLYPIIYRKLLNDFKKQAIKQKVDLSKYEDYDLCKVLKRSKKFAKDLAKALAKECKIISGSK